MCSIKTQPVSLLVIAFVNDFQNSSSNRFPHKLMCIICDRIHLAFSTLLYYLEKFTVYATNELYISYTVVLILLRI